MSTMILNNELFEVKKVNVKIKPIEVFNTLMECYAKPSRAKRVVWSKWCEFVRNFESQEYRVGGISVSSHNSYMMCIEFNIYDRDYNFKGRAKITSAHNYLYLNKLAE